MTTTIGLRRAAEGIRDAKQGRGDATLGDALKVFHNSLIHGDRAGHGPATVLGEIIAAGEVQAAEHFCEACIEYWGSSEVYDLDRAHVERQVWGGKREVLRCVRRNLLG